MPSQAGEKFLSSRIDFLNTATDKTERCIELGDNAQDFLYTDINTLNHIKYESQTYDSIDIYFDEQFSDNEYHLIRFKEFLASFDYESSSFKWLLDAENNNKYGIAISKPVYFEQTMFCTSKIVEIQDKQNERFKLSYLSQSNDVFEDLIETMAKGFMTQFNQAWAQLRGDLELRLSSDIDEISAIEKITDFYRENISSLETTKLNDFAEIEAQSNTCILAFHEEDRIKLSQFSNFRNITVNEYFKKAHGLHKIREILGIEEEIPFKQLMPSCTRIPEYILIWKDKKPAFAKGLLKDFTIKQIFYEKKGTTKLEFKFIRSDAVGVDEVVQLPDVNSARLPLEQLRNILKVEKQSPFAPDFVPVDQLCYNN